MKIRITSLIILLVLVVAACQRSAPVLKPKTFKLPLTEEQMLVWLKEHDFEVEKLRENRYSISWKEELPDGRIAGITYGGDAYKVLIESKSNNTKNKDDNSKDANTTLINRRSKSNNLFPNYENTAHFIFPLRLDINTDVIVSSNVELVQLPMPSVEGRQAKLYYPMPIYRYNYQIRNLQTSQDPVNTFQIYYSDNIATHRRDLPIIIGDLFDPENPQHLKIIDVSSPSDLWETSQVIETGIKDFKSTMWRSKNIGILPNESQHGFSVQLLSVQNSVSVPDIVLAGIDIDRRKGEKSDLIVKIDEKVINNSTDARDSGIPVGTNLSWSPSSVSLNSRFNFADMNGIEMVMKILLQSRPQGKVIGPGIIPADWGASELTQRLETLTSQSASEGWLNENTARQLKKYLTNCKSMLQKGQQVQAKQAIQAFADALKEMEIDVNLTQEAATLLGTNAAYLLTKF